MRELGGESQAGLTGSYIIELSDQEREVLEAQACRYTLPYRDVVRAKIVLMAAAGLDNDQIAARLDTPSRGLFPGGANASSPSGSAASRSGPGEEGQASFPPG